jgi:dienelactone hydrolase
MYPNTSGAPAVAGKAGSGVAGTGVAPVAGKSAVAGTGSFLTAGVGAAGSAGAHAGAGGAAGSAGAAGASAGAGGASGSAGAAGAAGSAGASAGAGGSAGGSATGGFIREDAPTDASTKTKGKYTVKTYTSGFSGVGTDFGAGTIYYPTDADAPFASLAVVPGFTAYQNSIADWGPFLASHGMVVMTIDTLTTADLPDQRADELMGALKSIAGENTRTGSPLMGKLDTSRQAVTGWSMGGGGTLIAASKNPTLKAAVSFAAWEPTGGATDTVPVLMFEGTDDPLAAGMSEPYYMQAADSTPKMLFEVQGAGHDVANSPSNSMNIVGQYGLSWLKVFLEGDDRYKQFLTQAKPSVATSKFETNVK